MLSGLLPDSTGMQKGENLDPNANILILFE